MSIVSIESLNNKPKYLLKNLEVQGAQKQGDIFWATKGSVVTITGECDLPDDDIIVMVEQVVDMSTVVNDVRGIATIRDGVLSLSIVFDRTGNWLLRPERLNRGLDRIGKPFNFIFNTLEFDSHE